MRTVLCLALAACHANKGPRCFAEGVPPPWHARQAPHALIDGLDPYHSSAAGCPLDAPLPGAPCTLPEDAPCYYVERATPCDPVPVRCKNGVFAVGRPIQY